MKSVLVFRLAADMGLIEGLEMVRGARNLVPQFEVAATIGDMVFEQDVNKEFKPREGTIVGDVAVILYDCVPPEKLVVVIHQGTTPKVLNKALKVLRSGPERNVVHINHEGIIDEEDRAAGEDHRS